MTIRNFITCHCHQGSLDTASTPEAFAAREAELQTGYLTVTDHGTLQAARRVFDLAKKKSLTPIIGLEAYLRDDDCPILTAHGIPKSTRYRDTEKNDVYYPESFEKQSIKTKSRCVPEQGFWDYDKYFHLTMHARDAVAYEAMVKILSKADARAEKHGAERKPLFTWADIEELGAQNVTMTSSCLVGVVQGHLLHHDNADIAIAYYEKLRSLCKPGNWFVEVFPHNCDKNWDSAGYLILADGTRQRLPTWKKLRFRNKGEAQLKDLVKYWRPGQTDELVAVMENRKWAEQEPKKVTGIEIVEDFIPNECRPWAEDGDVQRGANIAVLALAERYGDKVLIGDDSHYAHSDEKVVQDIRLQSSGGSWRFYGHYHRQSSEEAFAHFQRTLGVGHKEFESWVENSYAWAEGFKNFGFKTRKSLPTSFYPDDTLGHTMSLIEKHGRMRWDNPQWVDRLAKEIELLHENGTIDLLPYFFIGEEACCLYADQGKLTGPGRGSAAGLLLTYLLRITHVDPLRYGLSMERFLTKSRINSGKLPDIDMDFGDRGLILDPGGWLDRRFPGHYARISTDTSLKLRSAVKDVGRVLHDGRVPDDIEQLTKKFMNAPQGISDEKFVFGYKGSDGWVEGSIKSDAALQEYVANYPKEWEIVQKCLGLTRQKSVHACAVVITDEPVANFIPLTSVGDTLATQYTASSVEAVGGLKMDFLGVNSIQDIEVAIKLIQARAGWKAEDTIIDGEKVLAHEIVPFKGKLYSIWNLPEDQGVFRDFCEGKTATVFQFNTTSAVGWLTGYFNHVKEVRPDGTVAKAIDSIEALSAFTALDRPGPLDYFIKDEAGEPLHNMLVEYAIRARGGERRESLAVLDKLLPETYGVIVYQEQLQKVYQSIGQTSAEQADEFRVHISKKKMSDVIKDKEVFMPGAIKTLGSEEAAQKLWQSMETFGQYGFNKSHSTAYVIISYACAFLKHHFPLEWWTAVLRHADKDEINTTFWPHCGHLIDLPDVALSGDVFEIKNERIRAPLSLLHGVGEKAHAQLVAYRPYQDLDDLCKKIVDHKANTSTTVEEVNAETGEKVKKVKAGRSALNKGIIATLIISGAMDSLFPPDTLPVDAMEMYVQAMNRAKGRGNKPPLKADRFDPKYLSLNDFIKFQMRKAVLPAYTEPLLPMLMRLGAPGLISNEESASRPEFKIDSKVAPFAVKEEIDFIDGRRPWPDDYVFTCAAVGYVVEARKFNYGAGKEAMELIVDLDGGRMKAVKWGGKTGRLPDHIKNTSDLKGAIVALLYTKYREDKPFVIEDLKCLQAPLDNEAEASPEPTPESDKLP